MKYIVSFFNIKKNGSAREIPEGKGGDKKGYGKLGPVESAAFDSLLSELEQLHSELDTISTLQVRIPTSVLNSFPNGLPPPVVSHIGIVSYPWKKNVLCDSIQICACKLNKHSVV